MPTTRRGFTLIEMLVVVAIMIIVMGVVLANFPGFRDKTSIELVAQEVAITIRQAQEYAIGTRNTGSFPFPSFGIYLAPISGSPLTSFFIYGDKNVPPGRYLPSNDTGGAGDTQAKVDVFAFRGLIGITQTFSCNSSSSGPSCVEHTTVPSSILFSRPDPDAAFFQDTGTKDLHSYYKIQLTDGRSGQQRCVYVWTTGYIYASTC